MEGTLRKGDLWEGKNTDQLCDLKEQALKSDCGI